MAVAFRSAGATLASVDDWTLTAPAGLATDDILLAVFVGEAGNDVVGSGWTLLLTDGTAIDQSFRILWRRSDGADPVFFTNSGTQAVACLAAFSGALASGDPTTVGAVTDGAASATVGAGTVTPPSDANGVLFIAVGYSALAMTCSGYSGTAPTFTESIDTTTTAGAREYSIAIAFGVQATAAATGARTATFSQVAAENQGVLIALKPAAAVASDLSPGGYRKIASCYAP